MLYLLQALWGWLLAAIGLGVLVGFLTNEPGKPAKGTVWVFVALLVLAGGAAVAHLQLLPGRYGFWLETALLLSASYLLGCLPGCLARRLFGGNSATLRAAPKLAPMLEASPAALFELNEEQDLLAAMRAEELEYREAPMEGAEAPTFVAPPLAVPPPPPQAVSPPPPLAVPPVPPPAVPPAPPLAVPPAPPQAVSPAPPQAVSPAPAPRGKTTPEPASGAAAPFSAAARTGHESALTAAIQAALATNQAAQALLASAAPVAAMSRAGAAANGGWLSIRPPLKPRPASWADEDNLQLIRGVGEIVAHHLHGLDIWRFSQIAEWTPENAEWIAEKIPHHGAITPKYWIAQARLLAGGVDTDFSRAFRANGGLHQAPLDGAEIEEWHRALPQAIVPDANDELYAGTRPLSLRDPPMGERDDLTRIAGIDAGLAARLTALGIWTYAQIAHWSPENARWVSAYLASPGRVERETWVAQARALGFAASEL